MFLCLHLELKFLRLRLFAKVWSKLKANHNDYVLIDTAGRLQIDELLMNELRDVKALAQPNEILLVIDAMIGQKLPMLHVNLMLN